MDKYSENQHINRLQSAESAIFQAWKWRSLSSKERASRLALLGIALTILIISALSVVNAAKLINEPFPGFILTPRLVVSNIGQPYWSGLKTGLAFPDKILSVNGKSVHSVADFKAAMRNHSSETPMLYTIEREGKFLEITVPMMIFSWVDFLTTFGLEFVSGLTYLIIGLVVFYMKPDTGVSWSFLLLCSFLALYNITDFDKGSTGFARIYMLAMTFIGAAGLHLSLVFPERKQIVDKFSFLKYLPYVISTALFIPLATLYPRDAFITFYRFSFLYLVLAALALFVSTLLSCLKSSSVLARQRGKVILFGIAAAFLVGAPLHYFSFFGGGSANWSVLSNFLPIWIIVFPWSISYAIVKHNLFDVDVYIKRFVGFVLVSAIVLVGAVSIQTITSTVILRPLFGDYADMIYLLLFSLLIVLFLHPINRKVQDTVEKLFFRKKFDYKETVQAVSNALTSLLNLDQIVERVVHTVRKEMFIDTVGVIVLEPQKRTCKNYFIGDTVPGSNTKGQRNLRISYDDPLLALLASQKKLITKYDIEEDPRYSDLKESCRRSFAEMDASLALPMVYQGEVTGALTLGYKKSGHFYTREDIDLLDTVADEAAVAIENAKLAEQMKKEETVRTNLSRYLSPQIVDQIVKKDVQVNLGGDKKVVTVLFSDIRNFTGITETQPPDKLVRFLNEYFTEMARIIFENKGSLDKYIGDAIVAVFGSLIDLENSPRHAVQAAIEMMKHLPRLNDRWIKEYGFEMQIGIGLNTGEVFLGNIGSPERMEFTVIGDTVNVASRFSGLAKPGQILITRETLSCLGPDQEYRELPATEVKGKTEKLQVFELLGGKH